MLELAYTVAESEGRYVERHQRYQVAHYIVEAYQTYVGLNDGLPMDRFTIDKMTTGHRLQTHPDLDEVNQWIRDCADYYMALNFLDYPYLSALTCTRFSREAAARSVEIGSELGRSLHEMDVENIMIDYAVDFAFSVGYASRPELIDECVRRYP